MNHRRQLIALIIWLCEGTKVRKDKRWKNAYNYSIEVTNTDPRIIKIFVDFLRSDLKLPMKKLRAQVQIHVGDNQKEIELFWSHVTGVPINQFNKTIIRNRGNKPGKTKGTFKVRTYSKAIFERLQRLLAFELKELGIGV